jgi:hypothetical protein
LRILSQGDRYLKSQLIWLYLWVQGETNEIEPHIAEIKCQAAGPYLNQKEMQMPAVIKKPRQPGQDEDLDKQVPVVKKSRQERLLPMMVALLLVLAFFFFASSFWQLYYINQSILRMPTIDIQPASGATLMAGAQTFDDALKARKLEVETNMEVFIVTQRYHQVNVMLMAGLWVRYLGFITGMILAIVGASFVLGKLREPPQKLEGKFSAIDVSLRTTSPGIILVVLGVVLMFATLMDRDTYDVNDRNIYIGPSIVSASPEPVSFTPVLIPPDQINGTPVPWPLSFNSSAAFNRLTRRLNIARQGKDDKMKRLFVSHGLIKISLSLLLALILFLALGNPINVFSYAPRAKYSDAALYNTAFECEKKGDHFCALLFLFAYKTREPAAYLKNSTHKANVDGDITRLTNVVNDAIILQRTVNADLAKCNCYPCGGCQPTTRGTFSVPPTSAPKIMQVPPDVAVVCENYDYQGRCSFLTAGSYNNADQTGLPNDSISSVIVGSNVNLTLCVHGGLTGECTTFQSSTQDPNLSDNPLDNQYFWNDNTTSIRVDNK